MFTALGYYIALFFAAVIQKAGSASGGDEGPIDSATRAAGDLATWLGEAAEHVPKVLQVVAIAALYGIGLVALTLLAFSMWKRVRRVSLIVRAFTDGGVRTKVGPGVGALVEERLVRSLRKKDQIHDGYELDLVITDVDLLSEDNDLAKAMERLADVPQFQMVIGVLDLVERLLPSRGLAAAGDLLPVGDMGAGISLALYEGNRLTARTALWQDEVKTWLPDGAGRAESWRQTLTRSEGSATGNASAYYDLAGPAAWWVQYEAARALDGGVSRVTSSAESFALVGLGLLQEGGPGSDKKSEEAYASALKHDFDNVAALFNLAQLLSRNRKLYAPAALLLIRASDILYRRHQRSGR